MILTARFVLVVNHVNTSNDDKYVLGARLNYFLFSARLKILLPQGFQHHKSNRGVARRGVQGHLEQNIMT